MYTKKGNPQKSIKKQLVIVIIILLVVLFDMTPYGGNIVFYSKWIQCGRRPVQVASAPGSAWSEEAPLFAVPRTQVLYCTSAQAASNGYDGAPMSVSEPSHDILDLLIISLVAISVWYLWWRLKKRHNIVKTGNQSSRY